MNTTEIRTLEMEKLMIEYFGKEFMESNDKGTLKQYLCIEGGERFTIEATDINDAREQASVWNAEVIRELPN
jgi:hypothetical protein